MIAIGLREHGSAAVRERVLSYDVILSSNLLEAEVAAAFRREQVAVDPGLLRPFEWVLPERPLTDELERVFTTGYLKGADAWHIACALHIAGSFRDLAFLTLDSRQRDVAAQLGFPTP